MRRRFYIALTFFCLSFPRFASNAAAGDCSTYRLGRYEPADAAALQRDIHCAPPGSTIVLSTTAPYMGSFTLPDKAGAGWITIISSQAKELNRGGLLPPPGQRVSPSDDKADGALASILEPPGSTGALLSTTGAAHHYRFIGIKFSTGHWLDTLVQLGSNNETSTSQLPHHIIFDRCLFEGSPTAGTKHGLVGNAGQGSIFSDDTITVENSYFRDFKDPRNDAQAFVAWNGWGPFFLYNNYMEASGENVMFGGADPTIVNLIPSDITVFHNHFYKPLSWVGIGWRIKNLFELKNAKNVNVRGNVFQNNWIEADELGWAVLLTPRNQNGTAPWSSVTNVRFEDNLIENSRNGFDILGTDYTNHSGPLAGIVIRNNLLLNINATSWPASYNAYPHNNYPRPGQGAYIVDGAQDLTFSHNTFFQSGAVTFSTRGATNGFAFADNVVRHNRCSSGDNNCEIAGSEFGNGQAVSPAAPGNPTLQRYFNNYKVTGNIMFDGNADPAQYPPGNSFPASVAFRTSNIDATTGLSPSPDPDYEIADSHGHGAGVNWMSLKLAIDGVVQAYSK